jgi:hypothetical protein
MDELFTDMDQEQERVRTERNRYEPNPWLEHTGWERHLHDDHRRWVTEFVKAWPRGYWIHTEITVPKGYSVSEMVCPPGASDR